MIRARRAAPGLLAALLAVAVAGSCAAGPATSPRAPPPARASGAGGPPPGEEPRPAGAARYGEEPPLRPAPAEEAVLAEARRRLRAPDARTSPALVLAARELARAAARGAPEPLARSRVRDALARAGAADPAPAAHLAVAGEAEVADALGGALARGAGGPPTHLGAGVASAGGRAHAVLLTSRRRAALAPFPSAVALGATAVLAGELVGLEGASVHLTAPGGASRAIAAPAGRTSFRAEIPFDAAGRWLVEVVGRGPQGPEVAALLAVACGGASLAEPAEAREPAEAADLAAAEAQVAAAIAATRARHGLPPLAPSARLAAVARRHSEEMRARGQVAHVLREGDVGERVRRAALPYRRVLENVARARTALGAHRAIEESPAHRENVLSPEAAELGVGLARGALPTGEPITYLTEIFLQPVDDASGGGPPADARAREAIWRERARLGAPALLADPALDALAREAAHAMRLRAEPSAERLGDRALALGRKLAAVDAFAATELADVARSRNVADRRYRRVGVGVEPGPGGRYGASVLWIAVVYTD